MGLLVGMSILFTADGASSASLSILPLELAARVPGVLLGSIAPVVLALLVAPFIGGRAALFAAIFLAVEPTIVGWSRVSRLDFSQAFFVMVAVLCYARAVAFRSKGYSKLGGLGFAAGFATNPYVLFSVFPLIASRLALAPSNPLAGWKQPHRFLDGIDLRFIGAALIGVCLIYVNIWQNPFLGMQEVVKTILSVPHVTGEAEGSRMAVSHLFYLVRAPQRVLPTTLILAGLGVVLSLRDKGQRAIAIVLLVWMAGVMLGLSLPAGRKGFKNFLIVVPVLCIFAGIGTAFLADALGKLIKRFHSQVAAAALFGVGIAASVSWSPYPQTYIWPWSQDPQKADLKELIAQGEGVREAIDYIRSEGGEDSRVALWTGVNNAMYYFPRAQLGSPRPNLLRGYDWLVVLPKIAFAAPVSGDFAQWLEAREPQNVIYNHQVELVRIYRLNNG